VELHSHEADDRGTYCYVRSGSLGKDRSCSDRPVNGTWYCARHLEIERERFRSDDEAYVDRYWRRCQAPGCVERSVLGPERPAHHERVGGLVNIVSVPCITHCYAHLPQGIADRHEMVRVYHGHLERYRRDGDPHRQTPLYLAQISWSEELITMYERVLASTGSP
jgi:hypothetical protein